MSNRSKSIILNVFERSDTYWWIFEREEFYCKLKNSEKLHNWTSLITVYECVPMFVCTVHDHAQEWENLGKKGKISWASKCGSFKMQSGSKILFNGVGRCYRQMLLIVDWLRTKPHLIGPLAIAPVSLIVFCHLLLLEFQGLTILSHIAIK